ncbi:hypothetical protein [Amycolatopsis sp. NPDC051371]|uniref:hypothetical protein n=1 Tax=Amycolatopsis sp. NPDC051371 TaxID=3155800 RepID=UPI00342CDBDE
MSTKTDFYLRRGISAEWLGSVARDAHPEDLLAVPPGRLALTTTDETTYRDAVNDLITVWACEDLGEAYPRRGGWPWPWATSHHTDWIVAFDRGENAVFLTVGGGVAWHRINPRCPCVPEGEDPLGPPDIHAWLADPAAPPSVPMPLMRDPATGLPTSAGAPL